MAQWSAYPLQKRILKRLRADHNVSHTLDPLGNLDEYMDSTTWEVKSGLSVVLTLFV